MPRAWAEAPRSASLGVSPAIGEGASESAARQEDEDVEGGLQEGAGGASRRSRRVATLGSSQAKQGSVRSVESVGPISVKPPNRPKVQPQGVRHCLAGHPDRGPSSTLCRARVRSFMTSSGGGDVLLVSVAGRGGSALASSARTSSAMASWSSARISPAACRMAFRMHASRSGSAAGRPQPPATLDTGGAIQPTGRLPTAGGRGEGIPSR